MTAPSPAFRVTLDGRDLTDRIDPRLMSLTLTEKRGDEADQLDMVISDHDGRMAIPRRGAVLSLELGWRGAPLVDKGRFKVDEVEHAGAPDVVTVRARAADFTSALATRREKTWRGATLGQVLQEIAGRHGLTPRVAGEVGAVSLPVLEQSRESDLSLLRRLGKRFDCAATIKSGCLVFSPVGRGRTTSGLTIEPVTLTRADGDGHSWKVAERGTHTGVVASWHDSGSAKRQKVVVGEEKNAKRLRKTYSSEKAAREAADSEWRRSARGAATLNYTLALGRPDLYPERRIRVSGFKPEIDATTWLIAEAVHSYGSNGLTTSLSMETAP